MFEGIVGHTKQIELLTKALKNSKLAHAYVFAGPESMGKKLIAKKLAAFMLDMNSDFHPDFLEVSSDGVKIEEMRELTYKLSLKPYQAKYKVALIDNADQMTTEAANALLKTLEEPKDYTFIFLITSNPNRLPKTILSRSQKITFGPVDLIREETEEKVRALEFFEVFNSASLPDRLVLAYDIASLETDEIKNVLDLWLAKLQKNLQTGASKILARKISAVMAARKFLDANVNSKLLLTNLMLNT